ncbi:MAG TPA: Ig-like domain-containing protein, partial [Tepidisphaeraceae bacterium]|nr:Ig-like domain-containing protein [Tepidisphaeraceae bacterium]
MFKRFLQFAANTLPRNLGSHSPLMRGLAALIEPLESRTLLSGQLPASAAEPGGLLDAQVTLQMVTASPPTSMPLFSGSAPRDLIFDRTRDQLLVVQPTRVERYSAASGEFLDSMNVGLDLLGGDITPDGNFLYITEHNSHSIYKVNLASKAVSSFIVSDYLGTPIDLSIGAGGAIAIISQAYQGSGDNLRTINLANDSVGDLWWKDIGPLSLSRPAILARSADYSYVAITSASDDHSFTSAGVWSERFQARGDVSALAVSRNGDLHAISTPEGVYVVDDQIALVRTFSIEGAGVIFDPTIDVLYVADPEADTLTGYDTNSWAELFSIAIGENLTPADPFGIGMMTASDDGEFIYLATFFGVRAFHMSGAASSFGRPLTFRADVSASDTTGPQPGGSVTFIDAPSGNTLGQGTIISGSATLTRSGLPVGTYSIFASYSGDASFNPADSSSVAFEVTPGLTSLSL